MRINVVINSVMSGKLLKERINKYYKEYFKKERRAI